MTLQAEAPEQLTGHDWHRIWMIPAAASALVLLLFALFFRSNEAAQEPARVS